MKENRVILLVVILFVLIALGSIIYALINSGESINPFSNSGNSDKGNSGTEISLAGLVIPHSVFEFTIIHKTDDF